MTQYTFIGVGNMGFPMIRNLLSAGHVVRAFDLNNDCAKAAAHIGAQTPDSLELAVDGSEVVITMLPAGAQVRSVYDQLWALASSETLLIDSSTVDIETSQWCHDQATARGLRFVDAPVSGGISGAEKATLAFMIGGQPDDVQEARTYVEPMAGKSFAAGGPATGTAAKIVNNLMLHINLLANSEGSQPANSLGLDSKTFHEIVSASSGASRAQQVWYPVPNIIETSASDHNFDATFRAELSSKDLSLAIEAAKPHNLNLPAARLIHAQVEQLCSEGLGNKDCTLVAKYVNPDQKLLGYTPGI